MGNKPVKKGYTNDKSIDIAEDKLDIKYPEFLREELKAHNGGMWGYFERVYPVFDEEDKFHTFDDVVRQNENGWKDILPEGYCAIADDASGNALLLSTNKDEIVYYYNKETAEVSVYANNDDELRANFEKADKEIKDIYSED